MCVILQMVVQKGFKFCVGIRKMPCLGGPLENFTYGWHFMHASIISSNNLDLCTNEISRMF